MKIVVVTATYPYGSGEAFIGPEIAELVRLGHEVYLAPRQAADGVPVLRAEISGRVVLLVVGLFSLAAVKSMVAVAVRSPAQFGRSVAGLFGSGLHRGMKNLFMVPKAAWLGEQIRETGADHIHVHWAGTTGTLAMLASEWSGVPFSMTCHQWDIYEDNLLARKVQRSQFTRFISERGLEVAISLGADPRKCAVIHMGPERFAEDPVTSWSGSGVFAIATPASLLEVKGHRYLIEAIGLLKRRGLSVHLTCFGNGPLKTELQSLVARTGVSDAVSFAGHVPHEALLHLLLAGRFHLVCLPSIIAASGEFEGIPVSLMEAMALGIPVVSTLTGSIPELVPPDSGLLVPDRDPEALAGAMIALIKDPRRYRQAAIKCLAIVTEGWSASRSVGVLLKKIGSS